MLFAAYPCGRSFGQASPPLQSSAGASEFYETGRQIMRSFFQEVLLWVEFLIKFAENRVYEFKFL